MRTVISMMALLFVFPATGFPAQESAESGFFDPVELEGFVDGLMEAQLKAHHFAGAVVVVKHKCPGLVCRHRETRSVARARE